MNKKSRRYTRILLEQHRPSELLSSLSSFYFMTVTVYGQNRDAAYFLKIIHSFCQMLPAAVVYVNDYIFFFFFVWFHAPGFLFIFVDFDNK